MTIVEAQRDMRRAYVGGGPGAIVSAMVWLSAALAQRNAETAGAFAVLFIGGLFIFPLSLLVSRVLFLRRKEAADNPLGMTALESTIAMIGGLFAAYLFLRHEPAFVFPFAAIAVGTHYFVFKTVYGDKLFWALGAIITALGTWQIAGTTAPGGIALWVAAAELVFGAILTARACGYPPPSGSASPPTPL
jgi:hypothetical protein